MPDSSRGPEDRQGRRHARYDIDWRVTLKCPDWHMAAKVAAMNASRGGIFLLTTRPPPSGATVELTVALPDGTKVPLRGTVVHVVTPEQAAASGRSPGIGVRLDARHETDMLLMEQMAVASGARAASESTPLPSPLPGPVASRSDSAPAAVPVPAEPAAAARDAAPEPPATTLGLPKHLPIARAVGIDFGTTYSSLSVAIGDRVYLIPDEQGRVLHPSIVHYPEGGDPVVGWEAREKLIADPRRTVSSIKRLLGLSFTDPTIAGHLHAASYKTIAGPNDSILVEVDGIQYAVAQICGSVIAHVRDLAERQLGLRLKQVVMSVPVTFTEAQKVALRRAAQLAGLEVLAFIMEPVAGALAYGIGQSKNEIVAVYDFGGGTFDFTVLDMSGDHVRVIASEGDSWLGGDDFDLALASAIADAFWRATKVELRQRIVEWQRLLLACEQAKRSLSEESSTQVVVDHLITMPKKLDLRQRLDRPVFEKLCGPLFERSLQVVNAALDRAGLEPTDITQLVVTGGVSRIPWIRDGLARLFDREVTTVVNPEEAIALGAGLHAAHVVRHAVGGVASLSH